MMPEHNWTWQDYYVKEEGLHCTDIWKCLRCGKTVRMTGNREPVPGKCKGTA
ncbi:hypothetical protein LCGC14_2959280 [marine sediment metagenome]|uniref:Uncharacterized protein n=1 Tax=marine sediment metagenome TaxID=412755 RepID=A0A0F8XDM0_9ZZZZ